MKTVAEASTEILASFEPVGLERVSLLAALGRFSAVDVRAAAALPAFDQSAMDGYAVRASELRGANEETPVTVPVHGESRAGGEPPSALPPGTVMRIFTGAMLPEGADAVVLQEDTQREGDTVQLRVAPKADANVRRQGSDLSVGDLFCPAGTLLGAGEIAVLASQDLASVTLHRRPRVAIVCTGDELRDIGEPARAGSIVSTNAYALAAQVLEAGGEPWVLPAVRDKRSIAADAIRQALAADVVVISGGVSVGDYDVVRDALTDAGIALSFWKIQMKPGKPVSFARARNDRVPVLGLPGNPVSSWVTFELFVRPGLRKMLGDPQPQRRRAEVCLSAPLQRSTGRVEFARARLSPSADGRLVAQLAARQGSGSLPALIGVDALVVLPAESGQITRDDVLEALILRELPDFVRAGS